MIITGTDQFRFPRKTRGGFLLKNRFTKDQILEVLTLQILYLTSVGRPAPIVRARQRLGNFWHFGARI